MDMYPFDIIRSFMTITPPSFFPVKFFRRKQNKEVATCVVGDLEDNPRLILSVRRKIKECDVENGKLKPITQQTVIRSGGKVHITMGLTIETAEDLLVTLKQAVREAKLRRFWRQMTTGWIGYLVVLQKQTGSKSPHP